MMIGLPEYMGKGLRKSMSTKRTIFDSIMFAYLFCVLVIFVFQPTEEAMMNLSQNVSIFFVGLVLGIIASLGLNKFNLKTLGELIFEPPHKKITSVDKEWYKTFWGWQLLLFMIITLAVGFSVTQFSILKMVDKESLGPTIRLLTGLVSPNWDVLPRAVLLMIETIFVAFMATALAIPVSFILCFFAAKNIMASPAAFVIYMSLRTVLNLCRAVEAFIWAIIFSVWVGFGPFAGMLALMVHSIMSLTKQYSELVETVNDGPIEGIQSTGATKVQTIWFAIVPQVVLPFISFTIYRWDINIRMATIVGFVGGGGIGSLLQMYQGQAMWPEVACIFAVIAFVVWFMDTSSAYLREALK
jgi:phosphonate transport system permease protein